jgi:menaquinone-specific isochorismate synthase
MAHKEKTITPWATSEALDRPSLQSPGEGRLVSYSLPAPGISASLLLQQAGGQERFFWQNGRDRIRFAGFGVALQMMAWGGRRFADIRRKATTLFQQASLLSCPSDLAKPRLFGGFAFDDDFTPDNTWAAFHPAHFILPHYQLIQSGEESWMTINAMLPEDENLDEAREQLHEALIARIDSLAQASNVNPGQLLTHARSGRPATSSVNISYPMSYDGWADKINEAISRIKSTSLEKVVLSRVCELRSEERIDVCRALVYLNRHAAECTRFLFEPRPYHAFYGATPELLVQVLGKQVTTMALAGSMPRGTTAAEDTALAHQLLKSEKDRYEHRLVVESILRRLEPLSSQLQLPDEPEIYTLDYIHHLLTPIKAQLQHEIGLLPLVEILHPTPALGGSPRSQALDFIRHAESVPRGWYAGPVGWVNSNMDGEFAVAIRSAVAQERRVWLYSGAGIVADSQPQKEWAETALKFQPMFSALGLRSDLPRQTLENLL